VTAAVPNLTPEDAASASSITLASVTATTAPTTSPVRFRAASAAWTSVRPSSATACSVHTTPGSERVSSIHCSGARASRDVTARSPLASRRTSWTVPSLPHT